MHNSRLGCFTSAGIIAALITALAIAGAVFAKGGLLYSPGALNAQAGETLGGVTSHAQADCKACHTAPWETSKMADRCAACHTDIAAQMFDVAKLHGMITQKSPTLACRACHPEHRGLSAALTDLGSNTFPHDALGFSLNGHRQKVTREAFVCADCHTQSISAFDQAVCADCHQQMDAAFSQKHALDYGTDCLACHDGADRFGKSFTHNSFPFRLEGKHAQVNCAQCHANARAVADFQPTPTDCFSCHQKDDQHEGQFGTDCGACHTPGDWGDATFDHNLSAFKLEGKHANVKCEECHQNGVFKGTPQDCYSCHQQDDEHNGNFGTDCSACHTPSAWDNATFDHSRSNFPLTGAHQQVDCEKCHVNGQFAGTPTTCVNCHADPAFHVGAFGTDCAACHSTTAWSPATFTGRHTFPLNHGESGTVSCVTCHPTNFTTYTCYGCHEHSEADVRSEHLDEGISNFQNCMECHPDGREGGD